MYSSVLEEIRFNLESIQVLEQAIVAEMLAVKDNPKDRSIAEHRICNFTALIQQKSADVVAFIRDESSLRKEELSIIQGQTSIKSSDKKKPTDVIWQNFYDRAKQLREQYRKQQTSRVLMPQNTVDYFREGIFKAPFKQPQFSVEEAKGKYVDMHSNYLQFLGICRLMQESRQGHKRMHDYLWFLQHLDKFDDFPVNRKIKFLSKYGPYLANLEAYLSKFLVRSRPLTDLPATLAKIEQTFSEKYEQGRIIGWDKESTLIDDSKAQYCPACKKLFITNEAYVNHLMGKKHIRNAQVESPNYAEEEIKVRREFYSDNQKRRRGVAFAEYRVTQFREELATVIYDTMNLVRKKQTRGYQEVEDDVDSESQSEEADAPVYNPKNLPLGWDGKPIPYWLYKLHGLGIEYKCQICGNYSYWGRRAFEMHFQEWRHTYGMKCLKIPNTIHFKDITMINDALVLHAKLNHEAQESQFRPDMEEQYEDNDGNLLNKRTYLDMRKQGLIN